MSIQDILVYKMMVSKFCLPDRLVLVDKPIYWRDLLAQKIIDIQIEFVFNGGNTKDT